MAESVVLRRSSIAALAKYQRKVELLVIVWRRDLRRYKDNGEAFFSIPFHINGAKGLISRY